MGLRFQEAKFLWNEVTVDGVSLINEFVVCEHGPENPYQRTLLKSHGACCADWPEDAASFIGRIFSKGFANKEAEESVIISLIKLEEKPEWINKFIKGWVEKRDYLLADEAVRELYERI